MSGRRPLSDAVHVSHMCMCVPRCACVWLILISFWCPFEWMTHILKLKKKTHTLEKPHHYEEIMQVLSSMSKWSSFEFFSSSSSSFSSESSYIVFGHAYTAALSATCGVWLSIPTEYVVAITSVPKIVTLLLRCCSLLRISLFRFV